MALKLCDDFRVFDLVSVCRIRMFQWNELVHPFDTGEDYFVLSIESSLFLVRFFRDFEVDDVQLSTLCSILRNYEFIREDVADEDVFTIPLFNMAFQSSMDAINFNRNTLVPENYAAHILNSIDPNLFEFDFSDGLFGQLNHLFPKWTDAIDSVPLNSRIVFLLEIERVRFIDLRVDHPVNYNFNPVDHLLNMLPSNPLHKVHYYTADPLLNRLTTVAVSDLFPSLVTVPKGFDRVFLPENDSVDFGRLVGFLRARICCNGHNVDDAVWAMLRDRARDNPESAYPFALLPSPPEIEEVNDPEAEVFEWFVSDDETNSDDSNGEVLVTEAYFFEVSQPWESANIEEENCAICRNVCSVDGPVTYTCCDHVYHTPCLFEMLMRLNPWNSPCPLCRHLWTHVVRDNHFGRA